jgi:hypothetical protein
MDKKRVTVLMVVIIIVAAFWVSPATARELLLFDKPLTLLGYATQEAALGLHNAYDTEAGLQSALMNLFIEAEYKPLSQLKFYTAERLTLDWAYQLNADRDSWEAKGFNKSHGRFNVDSKYWQILNEAHATWTPGNFFFRLGKQIVSWGEVTAYRVMDQINPVDYRRGFADVEFENTIIPIWLLRSEFYPRISTSWLQDLAFEFVFNPNATWIPNQDIHLGNDDGGIWAPNIRVFDPTSPRKEDRIGSANLDVPKPDKFSKEAFGYAFRAKGVVKDFILSLNYYNALDHSPVLKVKGHPPIVTMDEDGRPDIHLFYFGRYPRLQYVGMTASRDIPFLKYTPLGGIAPVFRFETFYAFKETFVSPQNTFEKSDELRMGLGIDWKIKIPLLNPKAFFTISPEIIYRKLNDLPGGGAQFTDTATNLLKRNNYQMTLYLSTTYFNAKLTPSFYWWRDITQKADFYRFQLTYAWSSHWLATLGLVLLDGNRQNVGFEPFDNKDYIDFKLTYKWS